MSKSYNPQEIEPKFYQIWEQRGYFETDGNKEIQKKDKYFSIMLPPPNVTGNLHIGHAFNHTLIDIITRFKRMDGFCTLWQPGVDHAGIATQNVVEKQLLAKGINKEDLGREKFLEQVWSWKEQSGGNIVRQMRRLGSSPAWSRERFTMDEGLKNAVKKSFVKLYEAGLIVQNDYMINWCTHDGALSDIEVEYENCHGKLYYLRYPFANQKGEVIVATTRPETYFGDTAVMVNPHDERYKHLIGKKLRLPLIDREIQIIADDHVDMEFGSGLVKVTPAHDMNDYEVGKRHNLEFIKIFDEKGILNSHCKNFAGLERLKARELVVKALEEGGFIEKIEDHEHQVGHCYRCKNIVEPYISKQWFVKKEIAKEAIKKVNEGKSEFYPAHWINSFNAWMKDLRDWCISRQLWWGHQIPVFYCSSCLHQWATHEDFPSECPKCQSKDIYQDPDVLDTWFSSGLWPFSTLGWGNEKWGEGEKWHKEDLDKFYPNSLIITGFDILFFWVARMMFQSENALNELPFKDIYLHALVKDENGEKMSKSKGNVIDPLEVVEEYSADILRFSLAMLAVQGRDIRMSKDTLIQVRNFTNKLLNAVNFLKLSHESFEDLSKIELKTPLGIYMHSRLNTCIAQTRKNIEEYRFNDASLTLYRFFWNEFCDWGIELGKVDKTCIIELGAIFKEALKLIHPFMPFLSEYLYQNLSNTTLEQSQSIMVKAYPIAGEIDEKMEQVFSLIIEAIIGIRRAKATLEMANAKIQKAYIKLNAPIKLEEFKAYIQKLAKVENVEFVDTKQKDCVADVSDNLESFIPLSGVDTSAIITRLNSQKNKLEKEIQKLSSMLNNEKFVANAPSHVLETNRQGLANAKEKLEKVLSELDKF